MSTLGIVLIVIAVLLLGGVAGMLVYTVPLSKKIYQIQLVRTDTEKWGRVCSAPENEEQLAMFETGLVWAKENRTAMEEVCIENEGLKLYGEYYRFGGEKCVIILPGRCESLCYSYYFAAPYQRAGYDVLVIDSRAHGFSDGTYSTIGAAEGRDLIVWTRLLEDKGINTVYYHSICVGSAAGIIAMTDKNCPASVKGLITEGCFTSFRETFKRHMIVDKRPLFPVLDLVMFNIWRHTGTNVLATAPIRLMRKIEQRVLFLFGENDLFSVPEKSKQLYAACGSEDKRIVWFDKGGHSHLRINNTEKYDQAIIDFLQE